MFKIAGFFALSCAFLVNSENYNMDYELMNDEESYGDYGYNEENQYNDEYEMEEGAAEDDSENYDDNYDFSEFDGLYASQEGYDNDIAFGSFASIGQFPYTVYLRITKKNGKVGICSGSIVGPRTVLTAHHCFNGKPKSITVEAGTLVGQGTGSTKQVRSMIRWKRPAQISSTLGKDFGFMYVNKAFIFNSAVNKVMLCGSRKSSKCGKKKLKHNTLLYASGFGKQGAGPSGTLKYASMRAQSDWRCRLAFHIIFGHHICTKGGSGNTCGGDSGGPLVIRESNNGRKDIQVGVNSYSRTKCTNKNGNWDVFFELSYGKKYFDKKLPSYYKTGVTWV